MFAFFGASTFSFAAIGGAYMLAHASRFVTVFSVFAGLSECGFGLCGYGADEWNPLAADGRFNRSLGRFAMKGDYL
jgi:hypothetical protein